MDIIPIAPTPQPEPTVQNTTSPGTDDTGFNTVLNDAAVAQENSSGSDADPREMQYEQTGTHKEEYSDDSLAADTDIKEETASVIAVETPAPTAEPPYNSIYATAAVLNDFLEPTGTGRQKGESIVPPSLTGQSASSPTTQSAAETLFTENVLKPAITAPVNVQQPAQAPPSLSISIQGQAESQNTVAPSNQNQSSLLVAEINRLVVQNNDKVTIAANFSNNIQETVGSVRNQVFTSITGESGSIAVSASNTAPLVKETVTQIKTEINHSPLRQSSSEQLLSAKIAGIETKNETAGGERENLQQNSPFSQQAASPQISQSAAANTPLADAAGTGQAFSTHFQSSVPSEGTASVNPTTQTPSYLQFVQEKEVVNQIVNRFSLQTRLQSGRMTLQLHPAELGELKIDVEMKGDSLKANIFAQTQQAQEIIEKNLPRLRSILQEQGMSVDDLVVTFQSDTVDDFSQQQENLFQNQPGESGQSANNVQPVSFEQTIEESLFQREPEHQTGVNLTV